MSFIKTSLLLLIAFLSCSCSLVNPPKPHEARGVGTVLVADCWSTLGEDRLIVKSLDILRREGFHIKEVAKSRGRRTFYIYDHFANKGYFQITRARKFPSNFVISDYSSKNIARNTLSMFFNRINYECNPTINSLDDVDSIYIKWSKKLLTEKGKRLSGKKEQQILKVFEGSRRMRFISILNSGEVIFDRSITVPQQKDILRILSKK